MRVGVNLLLKGKHLDLLSIRGALEIEDSIERNSSHIRNENLEQHDSDLLFT